MSETETADVLSRDEHGPPYTIAGDIRSLADALAIARSQHPSRMLANTNGYRYGRFEERAYGTVTVDLMGSHIATFTEEGVRLWSRGWATLSTSCALSELLPPSVSWIGHRDGALVLCRAGETCRREEPFTEGTLFPYKSGEPS